MSHPASDLNSSPTQAGPSRSPESAILLHYFRKYRRPIWIGILFLLVVDGVEILPPLLMKRSLDLLQNASETGIFDRRGLAIVLAVYLSGALAEAICRYGWRMYLIRASMSAGLDLRAEFARKLLSLAPSFFDKRSIGDLMSLATSDTEAVRMALGAGLLTLADSLFYLLTVPIAMFLLSPKLMVLAVLPLPLVPWFVIQNERKVHARFKEMQDQTSVLAARAQEALGGIRVTKSFAREREQIRRFEESGLELVALALRLARTQTSFGPTLDFFVSLGLVIVLFFGGKAVIAGAVTVGTFVAFQRYIQKIVWPMVAVGFATTYYQRALASSARLLEVLDAKTAVPEPEVPQLPMGAPGLETRAQWRTPGGVEFRNLRFRFPGSADWVLSGIDLRVAPGERIAVVGSIGAGKSALLSLLPRLYPVERGMLLIDQVDVNDWPIAELRRQVGFVGQEVFLFSESVQENLAYGLERWNHQSDRELLLDAARIASVHEELLALGDGYETRLGERGVNLSGGQKQRLTIARALARQPSILILDDALSSVDVKTEERILAGLRERPCRNTELIAAHRISTVQEADRILVLERGAPAQLGTHAELLRARSGRYYRFYEQQSRREDLENYCEAQPLRV